MTSYRTLLGPGLLGLVALAASASGALASANPQAVDPTMLDFRAGMSALVLTLGGLVGGVLFVAAAVRYRWSMQWLTVALLSAAGIAALHYPALAQVATTPTGNAVGTSTGGTVVTLPYGEYVAGIQSGITTLLTLVATAVLAYLPVPIRWAVNLYGVDKLVKDAVGFAVAATPGASRDAKLDIDVGSRVLARALQKAIDDGAPRLIKAAGGIEGLQEKILSQMNLHPNVTAKEVSAAAPTVPTIKG